jgi:hypothetical protein
MLNDMMLWASKYDDDEVIECALNKVDLYHMEQNDAPRIVELVAQNDIETALQRIKSFGGNDKDGLQRKFILYMLCLMELTLLDSKDKPFRREAIEKLLRHLDDNLRGDYSILNWNDFFPSYILFLIVCELAAQNLDYLVLIQRTTEFELEWIDKKGHLNQFQLKILLDCILNISNIKNRFNYLHKIAILLTKSNRLEEAALVLNSALECASFLRDKILMIESFLSVSKIFSNIGDFDRAISIVYEALKWGQNLTVNYEKSKAFYLISLALAQQGNIKEALTHAILISDESDKYKAINSISLELAKQGKFIDAAALAKSINSEYWKSLALITISEQLAKKGLSELSESVVKDAVDCAAGISDYFLKSSALRLISSSLAEKGDITGSSCILEMALDSALHIPTNKEKSQILTEISSVYSKQLKVERAVYVLAEALGSVQKINDELDFDIALSEILFTLIKYGQFDQIKKVIILFKNEYIKSFELKKIIYELARIGEIKKANLYVAEIKLEQLEWEARSEIVAHIARQGEIGEALMQSRIITDNHWRRKALKLIGNEMAKIANLKALKHLFEEAISLGLCATPVSDKNRVYGELANKYVTNGAFRTGLELANTIDDEYIKVSILCSIFKHISLHQDLLLALNNARSLSTRYFKSRALKTIAIVIAKNDLTNAFEIFSEAIECARDIDNKSDMCIALQEIAIELNYLDYAKEAMLLVNEVIKCAREITSYRERSLALKGVSSKLQLLGKSDDANTILQEAFEYALQINDVHQESSAMRSISSEFAKQGKIENAIQCSEYIKIEYYKAESIANIAIEISRLGRTKEALLLLKHKCQKGTSKIKAYIEIQFENCKNNYFELSKQIEGEIINTKERQNFWEGLGSKNFNHSIWSNAFILFGFNYPSESSIFYLKGCVHSISHAEADINQLKVILPLIINDADSLKEVLVKYTIYEVFFGNATSKKLNQFSQNLNIQWAIDSKNKLI